MTFKEERSLPISSDVYADALVTRGWLSPHAPRNPAKWYYSGAFGNRECRLFARIRAIAMKAWDTQGIDLIEQVIRHVEKASPDCLYRAKALHEARRTFHAIAKAGFPHFEAFAIELDEVLDEMARLIRSEIVARLLSGAIAGDEAVEAIAALHDDPEATAILLAGIEELEGDERGFGVA
jgi:hypothetical protein